MKIDSKCKEIRKILQEAKSPVIFFDSDCDGMTSYLQLKRSFPKCVGFPMGKDFEKQKHMTEHILHETDVVLFIDTPIISNNLLEQVSSKKIVWIDHHPNDNDEKIGKYDITYLNPTTKFNLNLPGAYLAYKICDDNKNLPFAVLGSVADFFLQDTIIELEEYDSKMFNVLFKGLTKVKKKEIFDYIKLNIKDATIVKDDKRDDYIRYLTYETNVNLLRNFIESIIRLKEDEEIIRAVRHVEKLDLEEILININSEKGEVYENFAKSQRPYRDVLKKALESNYNENLFFFEYEGERGFAGPLSQEINYRLGCKIVGVAFKKVNKDYYTCSLRGRNIDVLKILEYAIEGLRASGGGHKFATGSRIEKDDFETFKKRIIEKGEEAIKALNSPTLE